MKIGIIGAEECGVKNFLLIKHPNSVNSARLFGEIPVCSLVAAEARWDICAIVANLSGFFEANVYVEAYVS